MKRSWEKSEDRNSVRKTAPWLLQPPSTPQTKQKRTRMSKIAK